MAILQYANGQVKEYDELIDSLHSFLRVLKAVINVNKITDIILVFESLHIEHNIGIIINTNIYRITFMK